MPWADAPSTKLMLPADFPVEILDGLPVGGSRRTTTDQSPVTFPFDGTLVARAPHGDVAAAAAALDEAVAAVPAVAAVASHVRRAVLTAVRGQLSDKREQFESLLVAETGKPLVDCRVETTRTLLTIDIAAEEVARLHGETVPLDLLPSGEGLIGFWVRRPIGVVVGIAGFNYPLLLAAHKLAPAFAAGCPVIIKPAPATPLATLWLVELFRAAAVAHGVPAAAVQMVTGDAEVGAALTTDRRVGAVSFTGSAAVGHQIARAAAPTKTLLELGSNSALLVAADADLDAAADAIIRGGFYASGQACISVQRVVAVEEIYETLLERLRSKLVDVVVGDPRKDTTRVSALIDLAAAARVDSWIDEALGAGARLVGRGPLGPLGKLPGLVAPTIVADVDDGCSLWDEEVFGPVVAVRSVPDLSAAIDAANRSRYGLHAAVFTRSLASAFGAIERLEVGGVVVNDVPGFRADNMPYGGVKDSGSGREGPRFAIEELTVSRMAVIRPA